MTLLTCDLYDAYEATAQVPDLPFLDFGRRTAFWGPIVTVKCFEDNSRIKELSETPGEGRVLVVDGGGSIRNALVGDMIGADLAQNGWAGVVVHGFVRDKAQLAELDLGIKALGTTPRRPVKRGEGAVGIELKFGGVAWREGDVLFADEDGVVVLTREEAEAAISRA
jgi:regulator of ribonuclease activity A